MKYLLDTNILLYYLRENTGLANKIDETYKPFSASNASIISIISVGEIRSIALQNGWGSQKTVKLLQFLLRFPIADIHVESIVQRYAEIDAFSQGKLIEKPLEMSARNMGKNDIWIAATASVLGLTLLTTDQDFQHLNGHFLSVANVELA